MMPPARLLPNLPSFRVDGEHALITGAGRGIGLACATALAAAGASVTLAARTKTEIDEVAAAINQAKQADKSQQWGEATALCCDITDSDQRRALVARSPNDPPFGILVNSAGFARNVPLGEVTEEDYDRVMDVNVKAAYFLAKLIAERLIADQKPGSIITISSQMGLVGGPNRSVYCASKHANEGYTKAMALELGAHQIRVNTVCPTFIKTDLTKHALANEEFRAWVLGNIALGRLGQPEDIAGAITYLASPASRLVTGIALPVDGGWTAK